MGKIKMRWSKREKDWIYDYTGDSSSRGKILGNNLFTMIKSFKKWKGRSLRETIEGAGFDPDSFEITIKTKEDGKS